MDCNDSVNKVRSSILHNVPKVLADKKHYLVNLHKHIQIMKIILKREGEAYSRRIIFV